MNLEYLIPTLQCSCSCGIMNHEEGTLQPCAGIVLAFCAQGDPLFMFLADTTPTNCLQHNISGVIVGGPSLVNLIDTVAGLGVSHEVATSKMACAILSHLAPLLYAVHPPTDLILTLAGTIDKFTVAGISNGIAAAKKSSPRKMLFTLCEHPERN